MRDGTRLLADIHRPEADGRFPALVAASPYPRQLQDLGAPASFLEAGMPGHLTWTSEPLPTDTDMVGQPELRLTATSTASGTAWILLLQDVDPDGNATDITEGWLRVGMRHTDEGTSDTGRAALPVQAGESIPPGQPVDYRIPLVTNARRFQRGHRIRLILTSDDTLEDFQPMALFSHAPSASQASTRCTPAHACSFRSLTANERDERRP